MTNRVKILVDIYSTEQHILDSKHNTQREQDTRQVESRSMHCSRQFTNKISIKIELLVKTIAQIESLRFIAFGAYISYFIVTLKLVL